MERIKITFLGTSDSVPTKTRNHPAILLTFKEFNFLIDCGEGTQKQFRLANLNPCKLTHLLITHFHGDHVLGIPGLLQTLNTSNYRKTLQIFGPEKTREYFQALKKITNFEIPLRITEVEDKKILETSDFYVETKSMSHNIPTNAYSFVLKEKTRIDKKKLQKLKLPNSPELKKLQEGKDVRINDRKIRAKSMTYEEKGKKITIILDTAPNSKAVQLAKDSDVLIIESTFSEKEKKLAKERKHLTASQAAQIAKKSKSKSLILTHISQRYEPSFRNIEKEAKKIFKNTKIARDFDIIEV